MHPPRAPQSPKSALLAGVALLLGLLAWSPPAQAQAQTTGFLGYATFSHHGTEPRFQSLCEYTYPLKCNCRWVGEGPWFDTVVGCSNTSELDAKASAGMACWDLCRKVGQSPGATGGTIARFTPSSAHQGVTLEGAGTIFQVEPGSYLGVPASGEGTVGPFHALESVGEQLTAITGAAWNWLVPGDEPIVWSDPSYTAAFVQSFRISDGGPPEPIGECFYSFEKSCEFADPRWGDRLRICSNQDYYDAWVVSETACTAMRHEAWFQSLQPWGTYSVTLGENARRAASGLIVSTADGGFVGYLPGSSSPSFMASEWQAIAGAISHATQGAPVWLAGPMEPYEYQP
ncbi:hypothetical protein ACN469_36200 [Corallococcus terminator]